MVVNPCCMPLQKGVSIIAIINIAFDIFNIVTIILALIGVTVWRNEINNTNSEVKVARGMLIVGLVIGILGLLLSVRLYIGAKNRDIRNCKIWLIVTMILFIIDIITYVINGAAGTVNATNVVASILGLVYTMYMLWVVYAFIQELKLTNNLSGFQARLEDGVGFTMQTYPPPPAYQQNQYPQGQATFFSTQPGVHSSVPNPQGGVVNGNNQYYTTGNI